MSEPKRCVRCERVIDAWARICPFCNWDQNRPAPAAQATPAPVADYQPPEERTTRQKMGYLLAGVLLLLTSFAVGMVINRDGAPKNAPEPITEQAQAPVSAPRRADTPLVPAGAGGIEQPFTSAPTDAPTTTNTGGLNEYDRSDATAVSSAEYAQLAERARAEKKRPAPLVDPRSLGGAAYAQGQRVPARRPSAQTAAASSSDDRRVSVRTRPVPQYQHIPRMNASGTAKLDLVIGPDGRVQDINIRRSMRGNTAALISAVQRWRFKPATINGRPVAAPYSVEISFNRR